MEKILYQDSKLLTQEDYKLYGIFNSILIATLLLCDVFIFKVINLFGFHIAMSGALFPITSLLMICINEIYGHKKTALAIVNLISAQIFFLLGLIFLHKIPSPPNEAPQIINAYNIIFENEWRVLLSSPVGIAVTLYFSSIINSKLKVLFSGKYLFCRITITSIITTAILVSIIYPINFFNILPWKEIFKITINTYVYKIIMAVVVMYISYPVVYFGKKIEKKDVFDLAVKYSPFYVYSAKSAGVNLYEKLHK